MKLSERLETIIELVPPSRFVADIGTDHGFVPICLVQRGICEGAVASDIGRGPLERAESHVKEAELQEKISLRLGGGLSTLIPGECDTVIIAGMGGLLMETILKEQPEVVQKTAHFVLSPHKEGYRVRRYLTEKGFYIEKEKMVLEEGKYYPVILFSRGSSETLTRDELDFGPILLKEKPRTFRQYLSHEEEKARDILAGLSAETNPKVYGEKKKELERIRKYL